MGSIKNRRSISEAAQPRQRSVRVTLLQHNEELFGIFLVPSARCYSKNMSVDLEKLKAAYKKAAALVSEDPVYLPVFERIEREIALFEKQDDAIQRAKAIADRYKAVA